MDLILAILDDIPARAGTSASNTVARASHRRPPPSVISRLNLGIIDHGGSGVVDGHDKSGIGQAGANEARQLLSDEYASWVSKQKKERPAANTESGAGPPEAPETDGSTEERRVTEEKTLAGGTKYKRYSDESQRFEYKDGTAYEKHAHHETHFNKNGDAIEKYDNGKTRIVYENGNVLTRTTDGDVQLEKKGGETILWQKDGGVIQTKDGISTEWKTDGSVNRMFVDSSSISWDKNGEVTVEVDDNTTTTFKADGTVSHLRTESSDEKLGSNKLDLGTSFERIDELPDGSVRMTVGVESADSKSVSESDPIVLRRSDEADGTAVLKSDDNSIEIRRSLDGTIRQIIRDGEHSTETTYYPTGEMHYKEGNFTIHRFVDGTVELQHPPASEAISIRIAPSGAATYVLANGTERTVDTNGRVTTVSTDGTVTSTRIEVEGPDGKTLYPDFSGEETTVTLADGSTAKIEQDEDRYVLVKPDGTRNWLFVDDTNSTLIEDLQSAKETAESSRRKDPPKAVQIMIGKNGKN